MLDMKRREFITLLGGAAAAWPALARAQQPGKIARVGVLMGRPIPRSRSAAIRFSISSTGPTRMWCYALAMHRSSRRPNARSRRCWSECGEHNHALSRRGQSGQHLLILSFSLLTHLHGWFQPSQRKSIVGPSLKRDILPLHCMGMTPKRRVTWQASSNGEDF
jgi:hypothetical protein